MNNKKIISIVATAILSSSIIVSCGKSSPQLQPNIYNPVNNNNPYNPNDPSNPYSGGGTNSPISTMGSVVGRVVDSTGQGLPNVLVSIKNISTTSTATGDFQLNNVITGQQVMLLSYGNRQLNINVNVVADTAVTPDVNPVQFSNNGTGGSGVANSQLKSFKVDQSFLNKWQAESLSVSGGKIYVAASDTRSLFKKGTIVSMSAEDGKTWKDVAVKWFGLKHTIPKSIHGVAVNGPNLLAVDTEGAMYSVASNKKVTTIKSGAGTDIAVGSDSSVYIVNGSKVEKTDSSGQSRSAIPNLTASGGIGTDGKGNLYVVSGSSIKKVDSGKNVTDLITQGTTDPIDVAVDDKNGFIYVLESSQVKRFTLTGTLLSNFGNGSTKAVSIATDEVGNVYVADRGIDNKTSKVVKFGAVTTGVSTFQNTDFLKNTLNFDGTGGDTSTATSEDTTATDTTTTDTTTK